MLRQQADRIAELEKEKIRAYGNGFEDGQKSLTTNAEPVAWAVYDHEFECYRFFHLKEENSIPLYTTPQTKPLSDEEIVEIYKSVKQDKDLTWEEWCITWEEWCKEQIEFARAIEERILGK